MWVGIGESPGRASSADERWFVVHTLPHRESGAKGHLENQGYRTFLPRRWKTRRHARKLETVLAPLFPRYLFIALDLNRDRWRPQCSVDWPQQAHGISICQEIEQWLQQGAFMGAKQIKHCRSALARLGRSFEMVVIDQVNIVGHARGCGDLSVIRAAMTVRLTWKYSPDFHYFILTTTSQSETYL